AACSQGTMNNLVFGNDRFSVYETIGGGAGASAHAHGASGVHVHMSNTRLTDPETLELRHPVRLERLHLRSGSGGEGLHRGGEGIVRRIRMLQPVTVCFVSQHRTQAPAGCAGGGAGACGEQRVIRADGAVEPCAGVFSASLAAGDAIEICTPGGGGYLASSESSTRST
ncbi:MAG: hydantoinase B/oxoprolinase family protein, partial [Phycisphaerae bacterium]|nr:hydantoinase B/oxoprolinase family protein [Phycisphaerae bacterium]